MDDNDIEFAVKLYKKNSKNSSFSIDDFAREIEEHKHRRPAPQCYYEPFSLHLAIKKLWDVLSMSMKEIVEASGLDMAKFSRRFCIPYRTLQAWCDGTNPCPIYVKLMICEILNKFDRIILFRG